MKSQKLSIYLIKDGIKEYSDIVKNIDTKEEFKNGVLYYKKSYSSSPNWTTNFFGQEINELKKSSASGLYITKIDYNNKDVYFGISFGHGWQMFKDGVTVDHFGIKTALSIIKEDIRKIEKKNFRNGLKDVSEQLGKVGTVKDFGFDVEQDIMQAIVGEPENKKLYGKNVVGKNALSLSVKRNVNDIDSLLQELYKEYLSNKYKEKFDWFDNFSVVNDRKIISELENKIIEKINNDNIQEVVYWLAIPEVIDWENTKCFKYDTKSNSPEYQDITFEEFRSSLENEKTNINIELLKKKKVCQIDINDNSINEWSIYKCLYAEVDFKNEKYLLVSGKYYKVDSNYKKRIEGQFIVDTSFSLPNWDKSKRENIYNEEVAKNDSNYQCLDGGVNQNNLIGKEKIEFADLVRQNKYLIHVKKYGSSAVLSHLFSQGYVSAEMLLLDQQFRKDVINKLISSHKSVINLKNLEPSEYTIVYAIGTTKNSLKLPFFSIVNYVSIKKRLELYRYKVLLIKINQV